MASYVEQYEHKPGKIELYRRGDIASKVWYGKLTVNGKTIRRSLKTIDRDEAGRKAEDLLYDLEHRESRGLSLSPKAFKVVANAYIRDFAAKVERDSKKPRINQQYKKKALTNKSLAVSKYLIPYFDNKNLQDITDQQIRNYERWRLDYWVTGKGSESDTIEYIRDGRKVVRAKVERETQEASYDTINKELTVIRAIYEYAQINNIIESREVPIIKNLKKPTGLKTRKSGLTADELKHLISTLRTKIKHQTNPKHLQSHKLLLYYISFMCLTGIRTGEANNIKISDCTEFKLKGKPYLKVFVTSKDKSRELIALPECVTVLNSIIQYHKTNALNNGWTYNKSIHLFTNYKGQKIKTMSTGLDNLLKEAGLQYDIYVKKRNAGAFRKYYITTALLSGVNWFELAKQVDNSVTIIEKHYAEIDVTETPERFIFENAITGTYKTEHSPLAQRVIEERKKRESDFDAEWH